MKPYYEDEFVTLFCAPCEEVVSDLSGVDLVFTSPPYNLSGDGTPPHGSIFQNLDSGYADSDDDLDPAEYQAWQRSILRTLWETLSDTGAIFYNHKPRVKGNEGWFPFGLIPEGLPVRQVITWDRGSGFMRVPTFFVPSYEWIFVIAREGFRLTTRSVDDVWRIPYNRSQGNPHPAPFPVDLPATAINAASPRLVLDPFAGSGTTLVAAKAAGVRCVGIEKSEEYCEMAVARLAQQVIFRAEFGECGVGTEGFGGVSLVCGLPADHLGWHSDSTTGARFETTATRALIRETADNARRSTP